MSITFGQEAIDAAYEEFGHDASYEPAGGADTPTPCVIIVDIRDGDSRPDDGRPVAGKMTIEVRLSEIACPQQGDIFTFDGRTVRVMNRPILDDEEGYVWKMWAT